MKGRDWTMLRSSGPLVKMWGGRLKEDEVLLSVVRVSRDDSDVIFTPIPISDFSTSYSALLSHITSSAVFLFCVWQEKRNVTFEGD